MKRSTRMLACLVLCAGFATMAHAQSRSASYTDGVTNGRLVVAYSNEVSAFELKRLTFYNPAAALTNDWTITQIRTTVMPDILTTNVVTNAVTRGDGTAWIETNYPTYSGGSFTNVYTYTMRGITNSVVPNVFDGDDFGWGWTFEPGDEAIFTFSATARFTLIRDYNVYPRP